MQYFRHSDMYSALAFIVSCSAMNLQAAEPSTVPLAPQDNSIETINKLINQSRPDEFERLPTDLPSDDSGPKMSKEESKAYLKANPAEFEKLLSNKVHLKVNLNL